MSDSNSRFSRLNNNLSNYYNINDNNGNSTIKYTNTPNKEMYTDQLNTFNNFPIHSNPIKYTTKYPIFQLVNSNDRDRTAYPNTNNFKITFQERIKNIVEIELITVRLPNKSGILDEPYLLIDINELKSNINCNSNNLYDAFAILPLKKPDKDTDGFITPELGQNNKLYKRFKIPLASLDQITISVKDMYGNLYDFGSDPGPDVDLANSKKVQVSFVFKFTIIEPEVTNSINVQYIN